MVRVAVATMPKSQSVSHCGLFCTVFPLKVLVFFFPLTLLLSFFKPFTLPFFLPIPKPLFRKTESNGENKTKTKNKKKKLTTLHSAMAHINQKHIRCRLGRPDHVLARRDKLDDRVVQLCARPTVAGGVAGLIPVEELGDLVGHGTHAAAPADFRGWGGRDVRASEEEEGWV